MIQSSMNREYKDFLVELLAQDTIYSNTQIETLMEERFPEHRWLCQVKETAQCLSRDVIWP